MASSRGSIPEARSVLELPLGDAAETFDLETAVCSHGLFMMSPNRWDPLSRSLSRPLRLTPDDVDEVTAPSSVDVRVSHHRPSPSLRVEVSGVSHLSVGQRRVILAQVERMLRLSAAETREVSEFLRRAEGDEVWLSSFGGRVFRSPTLFEDMVKCILLCNCQWPRTLSMARSLCELQWELQSCSSGGRLSAKSSNAGTDVKDFIPNTPASEESKGKRLRRGRASAGLANKFAGMSAEMEPDGKSSVENSIPSFQTSDIDDMMCQNLESCQNAEELDKAASCLVSENSFSKGLGHDAHHKSGNFPSPRELASLDEFYLANRCNLGYRASRILKLAQSIVEGKIQLTKLEEACSDPTFSTYDELLEQLRQIDGFGPFTCANVLMCMGFYHVIPTDSETIRHLKQVHSRTSNIQTVQRVAESIYGKYSPFQFLAYWAEVWHFYSQRFGKLSEMPCADYKLITASNMKRKNSRKNGKQIKASPAPE